MSSLNLFYELGQVNQFGLSVKFKCFTLMNSILMCFLECLSKLGICENGLMTSFLDKWKPQASESVDVSFTLPTVFRGHTCCRSWGLVLGRGDPCPHFPRELRPSRGTLDPEHLTRREVGHIQIFAPREFWTHQLIPDNLPNQGCGGLFSAITKERSRTPTY